MVSQSQNCDGYDECSIMCTNNRNMLTDLRHTSPNFRVGYTTAAWWWGCSGYIKWYEKRTVWWMTKSHKTVIYCDTEWRKY